MLSLSDLRVAHRRHVVLDGVSAELRAGFTGLLGVNGAGKTTLLDCLSGLRRPDRGAVRLDGHELFGRGGGAARSRIALVPQELALPGRLTVQEFLAHMAWMRAVPRAERATSVDEAIERVDLADRRTSPLGQLSGGMRRRVLIAQALLSDPEVLLLDEPTTGLDPEQRHSVRAMAADLGRQHLVLMSSHVVEDIAALADRVLVLSGGRIAFDGSPTELGRVDPGAGADPEAGFLAVIQRGAA